MQSTNIVISPDLTMQFRVALKQTTRGLFDMSRIAADVRSAHGYPTYIGWLKSEFGLSRQTGDNLLNIHKNIIMSTLKFSVDALDRIAPSVLYLLAAPSTPEGAREEVLENAQNGHAQSVQDVRETIADHRDSVHAFISDEDYDRQITEAEYQEDDEPLSPYEAGIARSEANRLQQIRAITESSKSNEWYTPAHIIERARTALGGIDLDPASSITANVTVQAASYCTVDENGYAQPWYGRVWLNPPYGKEENERETNAMRWSRKLIAEYDAGHVTAAILLVKAALGYNWFEELWYAWPTCLLRERLSFVRPDGSDDGESKHATALIYLGQDVDSFRSAFRSIGRIVLPESNE